MPSVLNQFLDTLSTLTDRRPVFDDQRCLNQLHRQAGQCSACAAACPVDAITLAPVPELDATACLGCDACAAVCPTSALRGQHDPLAIWREAVQPGRETAFVCAAVAARNAAATSISCLSAFPPEAYIALRLAGMDRMTVYTADCEACPLHGTLAQAEQAAACAREFLAALGLNLALVRETGAPPLKQTGPPGMSRRGFLAAMFKPQVSETEPEDHLDEFIDAGAGWRQALLLDQITRVDVPDEAVVPAKQGCWGALTVDAGRCIGCEMCTQFCPSGALAVTPAEQENRITLWFCEARCTGCGLCVRACFKRAITLRPEVRLKALATCQYAAVWQGRRQINPLSNMAKRSRPPIVLPTQDDNILKRDG